MLYINMNNRVNSYPNAISTAGVNRLKAVNNRVCTANTIPMKNDVFFCGLNKPFNLSDVKKSEDIPKDANIFLFNCNNKLSIPEDQDIKECIITDKGFNFWRQLLSSDDTNTMRLKNNTVEYAHGDLTSRSRTRGVIELDNSNVRQIEGVTMVRLKNNSKADFIDKVNDIDAFDSKIGEAKIENAIHMNGNCEAGSLSAYTVISYPGDKIGKIKTNLLGCKGDSNKPDSYNVVDEVVADEAAEITQTRINKIKTKNLVLNNTIAKEVDANSCMFFNNGVVDHFKVAAVDKMTDSKINRFDLTNARQGVKFYDNVQIEELNLYDDVAQLFFFPKTQWGNKTNNYINKITVQKEEGCIFGNPKLRIQGDVDVGMVEFRDGTGLVELTRPENPEKPIRVINGYIKYDVPKIEPPKFEDADDISLDDFN